MDRIQAVLASPSDRLDDLVRSACLDPTVELRFGDWRGVDLRGADLRSFDFTGADLAGALFSGALIKGAIFDRATYHLPSLQTAADYPDFVAQATRRRKANRLPSDRTLEEGQVFRDMPICPELIAISGRAFLMGSSESEVALEPDDRAWESEVLPGKGKHRVRIRHRLALGRYPVTCDEYGAFLLATQRRQLKRVAEDRVPVVNVSWEEAQRYCAWLNAITGLQGAAVYRLPSDAEWEYACRAGTETRRWWGDQWDHTKANGNRTFRGGRTNPVDHFAPNPWGFHDMIGNVWEWVEDVWETSYQPAPKDGTARPETARKRDTSRVVRGGSWGDPPQLLRAACHSRLPARGRNSFLGFRVARTLRP
jgi:formylglycine-generating enzyme required for sulfatase activity